jgi:methanogenic corrinoid protein MtbC1
MSEQRGHRDGARRAPAKAGAHLSIGDVAEATGISVDTLRAWERRYGRPRAIRLPSGHRRYTTGQVRWLRRVAEALAWGHKPSRVVPVDDEELDRLLAAAGDDATEVTSHEDHYLDLVRAYRREELASLLQMEWRRLEPLDFFEHRIGPLLVAVGRLWANGELDIRHEHFRLEVLEDLLRSLRVQLPAPENGPTLVLSTLPGESHGLGLQMIAILAALHGATAHVLGTNVPPEEMVTSAAETNAEAVAVSISLATGGVATDRILGELRHLLPEEVTLLVGGAGARGPRRGPRGVTYLDGLADFDAWLRRRVAKCKRSAP